MIRIRDYLRDNILLTDGAMGTYYSQLTREDNFLPEFANITKPEIIKGIHTEYINSGAKLIRTNTFSVNRITLNLSKQEVHHLLKKGLELAKEAAEGKEVFIAADIGPIPEVVGEKTEIDKKSLIDEYKLLVDNFLEAGADIFVFETFSSTDCLAEVTEYIKEQLKEAFILTQFAATANGYTRKGISMTRIMEEIRKIKSIDAYGFNCGTGPTHLYNFLKKMDLDHDLVAVLPNAGYPEIINERTVFVQNPEYFSDIMMDIKKLGVKIIGGCCGTTPLHIRKLAEKLEKRADREEKSIPAGTIRMLRPAPRVNSFHDLLIQNKFPVVVELDPPSDLGIDRIMEGAAILKENGADLITISDSPLGRVRVDALMLAAKIKREIGIDTIPHLSCRDKNIIAIKSGLLAAYTEGIRNILAVTGDPIPRGERSEIKSVFNLNSIKLMKLISEMNKEFFDKEPYNIGGALNLNHLNKEAEILRMHKKVENGATFFLTQPIFSEEVVGFLSEMPKKKGVKILGGIMPVVSFRNALFLNNEIPGISIPEDYINKFRKDMSREEAEETGIEIAVGIAAKIRNYVDGFYFITPFNRITMMVKILREVLP